MSNSTMTLYRNINASSPNMEPDYERWFPKTIAEAVIVEGLDGEKTNTQAIVEKNLKEKLLEIDEQLHGKKAIIHLLSNGWSNSSPYTQTIKVENILSSDIPVIGLYYDTSNEITSEQESEAKQAMKCITYIDSLDGALKVTCVSNKPTSDFYLQAKW